MYKSLVKFIGTVTVLTCMVSCGSSSNSSNTLRVGVQSGPELKLAETAQKVAKEKFNLDVELVTFTDYVMPNEALNQKDIDLNVFQTRPYLEDQSRHRGYQLAVIGNTFIFPMAGYSKKIKNIAELKKDDTIVIPNDPTNLGRALLLLEETGLIKLKEDVGLLPTQQDITENPIPIQILELEAPQIPRTLEDNKVTVGVINNNFAASNNLMAKRDGIFVENQKSPYVNIIVSRQDNKDDERVQQFLQSYQSDEVDQAAAVHFKGGAIKGW
ncbi:MAG: methionine ABC transporter substrate-binding lipoprotein MetQ [Sphingobacterium sp.]